MADNVVGWKLDPLGSQNSAWPRGSEEEICLYTVHFKRFILKPTWQSEWFVALEGLGFEKYGMFLWFVLPWTLIGEEEAEHQMFSVSSALRLRWSAAVRLRGCAADLDLLQTISWAYGGSGPRDVLYSPECQRRPCQLDELKRQIPSEDPVSQDHENQTSPLLNLTCVAA